MIAAVLKNQHMAIEHVAIPTPQAGQVLVKNHYCGVCGSDLNLFKNGKELVDFSLRCGHPHPMDLSKGVVMGHEFCSEIVEYGVASANNLKTGELVVARPQLMSTKRVDYLGFSSDVYGGFGEYMVLDETEILRVPNGLPAVTAALTEPLAVAEHAINLAGLSSTDCPLVVGCGPIGLAIITLLKRRGITHIVASEPNDARRLIAERLGVLETLNPITQALTDVWLNASIKAKAYVPNETNWVLFNCAGSEGTLEKLIWEVPRRTKIVQLGLLTKHTSIETMLCCSKEVSIHFSSGYSKEEFERCLRYLSEGEVDARSIITSILPLSDIEKAFAKAPQNTSQGKVIIKL